MKCEKSVWAFLGSGFISISVCIATVFAGPVSLPFFEPFNTISADATVDYPQFTAQQAVGGAAEHWTVDSKGLRTSTVTFANLDEPAFSVTPNPKPTGGIVINVDMGWNGQDANPPNGPGTGANGLRFGRFRNTPSSESTMLFHPGYNAPPGAFRINGPDTIPNENMGWVPQLGVLNHVEVHSFPDGTFDITVTDGTNPANVFQESFTDPDAYGGDIGLLAAGWGAAIYKNLSITLGAVPPVPGDYNGNGVVDAGDYVLWRKGGPLQNEVDTPGTVNAQDYTEWRARYGNTSGSGLGSGSGVPEPATLTMLGAAGAAILLGWRKLPQ
jgi:hypothetical protein